MENLLSHEKTNLIELCKKYQKDKFIQENIVVTPENVESVIIFAHKVENMVLSLEEPTQQEKKDVANLIQRK